MSWIFLAIAATFLWAVANLFDKALRTRHLRDSVALTASFGLFTVFFAGILFLFIGLPVIPPANAAAAFIAGAIVTYAIIPYFKALSLEETSRVIPMWHFASVFTLILAVIFLGEILAPLSYAAFALMLAGGFLISVRRIKGMLRLSPAMAFMLLSSFLFAVSDVLLKFSYSTGIFWDTYLVAFSGGALSQLSLFALPSVRKSFSGLMPLRPHRRGFILFVLLSALTGFSGGLLWNNAILLGPVTLVSVFTGFQSFFVLILATACSIRLPLFMKEAVDARTMGVKLVAIALMAAGLLLLSNPKI